MSSKEHRLERIEGCLMGGAIGDAIGYPIEFLSLVDIKREYGSAGVRGIPGTAGNMAPISDDTQMTLFTAEGLMLSYIQLIRSENRRSKKYGNSEDDSVKGFDLDSVAINVYDSYQRWLLTQTGRYDPANLPKEKGWLFSIPELHARRAPGDTCLSALRSRTMGSIASPVNNSKGCGGVMRVAPVAMFTFGYSVFHHTPLTI